MRRAASFDRFTVIAIAVIAYAGVNICHELLGHCTVAALLGARCSQLSSTNIPLIKPITEIPAWKYNVIVMAGCAANWTVGLACLALLRSLRTARSSLRYFLWLFMCVSLFLPSTYMTVAPIIKYGDSYILIHDLPGELFWRIGIVLAGATICWLSFRLCRTELRRLVGCGGRAARRVAWELVVPAYMAGGILTVTSALFSQLDAKLAQLQAAGGTFGLTGWLLLLPLGIPEEPESAEYPFAIPRSVGWVVAGVLVGLIFVSVLGPGISL